MEDQNETRNTSSTKTAQQIKTASEKTTKAVKSTGAALKTAAIVLLNPKTWIGGAVVFLIFAVAVTGLGITQVVGKNENIDGCSGWGSSVASLAVDGGGSVDIIEARNVIGTWMTTNPFESLGGKPFTKEQAAGALGNMQLESGLNPGVVQRSSSAYPSSIFAEVGDYGANEKLSAFNKKVGAGYNDAVGLIQWDGPRRVSITDYAVSQGKPWHDINIQLTFLDQELAAGYGERLDAAGWNDTSKTAADFAKIWLTVVEGIKEETHSKVHLDKRQAFAEEAMADIQGGTSGGSCMGAGSYDNSSAAALAISIAYPTRAESVVGPGDGNGVNRAPQAYKDAKAAAELVGGKDYLSNLYASCDRFVATVVKLTMDPEFPWGDTSAEYEYLRNSPKWEETPKSVAAAEPGDVWIFPKGGDSSANGHIMMYVGSVDGVDSVAHASYQSRVGAVTPQYLSETMTGERGRQYIGYRYAGG